MLVSCCYICWRTYVRERREKRGMMEGWNYLWHEHKNSYRWHDIKTTKNSVIVIFHKWPDRGHRQWGTGGWRSKIASSHAPRQSSTSTTPPQRAAPQPHLPESVALVDPLRWIPTSPCLPVCLCMICLHFPHLFRIIYNRFIQNWLALDSFNRVFQIYAKCIHVFSIVLQSNIFCYNRLL
jgi:hypothetical protein